MTKILFSKSIPVPGHPDIEVFYEKFWERGLVKPLWRWGETIHCPSGQTASFIQKSHLFTRPNIKRYIKRTYHV